MGLLDKFNERRKSRRQSQIIADTRIKQATPAVVKEAPANVSSQNPIDAQAKEPSEILSLQTTKELSNGPLSNGKVSDGSSVAKTSNDGASTLRDIFAHQRENKFSESELPQTLADVKEYSNTENSHIWSMANGKGKVEGTSIVTHDTQPRSEDAKGSRDVSTEETSDTVREVAEESRITDTNAQVEDIGKTSTVEGSLKAAQKTLVSKTADYNPIANIVPPPREKEEDKVAATRHDVESTFEQFANFIHASNQPLPAQTGDGSYLRRDEPTGLITDLKNIGFKEFNTVRRILEQKASGVPQDDRQYLMEAVMQLVAALPERSKNRVELTSQFLDDLWNSLKHPPLSYLGDEFKYRSADGSRNNYKLPQLGAANTPYARSVNPVMVTPGAKPDPFLVFDAVMARHEFQPNPNRVSSVFFNFASLVIHDLFQTDHKDPSISKTSSYLDLSILYGDCQEDQNLMRTFKDGKIKPDCWAEQRLLAFPPTAGVLLVMLNRHHNYVVEQLAIINENGRFTKPSDELPDSRKSAAWKKYDEDLFQTARLVTSSLYINIILYDYLRTIVNLNRTNSTWTLDPRLDKPGHLANTGLESGVGNQVSAEFALCYRWHAPIGELDEAWTEQVYRELFGKNPEEIDVKELMIGLAKYDHELPDDPFERPFANLKRGPDGKFNDEDLATIMINAVEQVSGAFGARNTPKSMRAITVLGMLQARQWNMCTLNEFRQSFGLKKFDTFADINSDPYVAEQLKNLYEHPDYVELYPGIMVEDAKTPMVPGVGICPNHTLARAVLSDAVALVRGDRFYTIDYNPKNLTQWGWNESMYDLSINQGCVMYKLFLRALPNHFKPDSIYAHYPMTIPEENANIMKDLGRFHDYNWEKPSYISPCTVLTNYNNSKYLLETQKGFSVMWNESLGFVLGDAGKKFCLGGDTALHKKQREIMRQLIYRDKWHDHIKHYYQYITQKLIAEKTVKIAGINQMDIVRDVGNLSHVHFAANMFALPLKTDNDPKGIFTDYELWMATAVIYMAVFMDFEPSKSFPLKQVSRKLATMIGKMVELNIKGVTTTSLASYFFDTRRENNNALAEYGTHMISHLAETGMSTHEMAFSQITPTAVSMIPTQSQAFAQIIDFYLEKGKSHWPAIQELAEFDTAESDEKLLRYVQEGIRLSGNLGIYRGAEVNYTFEENGKHIHVKPGDKVLCNFIDAARDPAIFPNPEDVVLDRPLDSYFHYGFGLHSCLGQMASLTALTAMLRTIAKLPGLRRAPGPQGQLKKIPRTDGPSVYMTERQDDYFAFPTTMKVHYDGYVPDVPVAVVEH